VLMRTEESMILVGMIYKLGWIIFPYMPSTTPLIYQLPSDGTHMQSGYETLNLAVAGVEYRWSHQLIKQKVLVIDQSFSYARILSFIS